MAETVGAYDSFAPYEAMSASMLSRQPATVTIKERSRPDADWQTIFNHLETRLGGLRNWRYSWWAYWSRLAEFFLPRRYHWVVTANRMARGSPINDQIVDSTGLQAVRTCAAGMWTGLTSPSRPWFKLGIGLPWVKLDAEGKSWLEDTEQRLYTVLNQSNFYTQMAQAFQDVTVFGTAPIIIYEDFEDAIRVYLPCAGEYYLGNSARGDVDTFYREFTLTVAQIVGMFTLDACPEQVAKLWEQGGATLEQEFVVCHAIEPNFPIAGRGRKGDIRVVPSMFAYREVYWLKGVSTSAALSRRGFRSKPFMVARWSLVSNDAYGRSPCMDALGDNRQVQMETRRKAEFIEKGVRPPMGADPSMKNEPSSIIPGMVTYISTDNGRKGFWPLFEPNPAWLPAITNDIDKVNLRIEKCLFVTLFMAISQMEGVQPRNELELTKRDLERLQELGPVIELFEKEVAGPAIVRVLDILQRRRMLRPMPDSLRSVPLKIIYLSIMKLAQRSAESVAMKDVLQTAGALSSAAKAAGVPDPLRVMNLDEAMRHYADLNNFPTSCMFTLDQVDKHDQIRAKAQQQAQAPAAAMAAVQAAKTLSETQTGGGTALGALLGTGSAGAPLGT